MIKISHEVPMHLIETRYERSINDYSYFLVHLFQDRPDYYEYAVQCLRDDRAIILDNSIFELEEAFDSEEFVFWINRLASDSGQSREVLDRIFTYIVPDVLDDTHRTVLSAKNFTSTYQGLPGKVMLVAQGQTMHDLVICYEELCQLDPDKIGVSFNCKAYEDDVPHRGKLKTWMKGRHLFVETLYNKGILDTPLHLLGCALPQEFAYYTKEHPILADFIDSLDTSNPIVHGLKGIYYNEEGLDRKESIKLVDLFDVIPNEVEMDAIKHNVKVFKAFCGSTV